MDWYYDLDIRCWDVLTLYQVAHQPLTKWSFCHRSFVFCASGGLVAAEILRQQGTEPPGSHAYDRFMPTKVGGNLPPRVASCGVLGDPHLRGVCYGVFHGKFYGNPFLGHFMGNTPWEKWEICFGGVMIVKAVDMMGTSSLCCPISLSTISLRWPTLMCYMFLAYRNPRISMLPGCPLTSDKKTVSTRATLHVERALCRFLAVLVP